MNEISLKEKLLYELTNRRLATIEEDIRLDADYRRKIFPLVKQDFIYSCFGLKAELTGYGKALYDKLIELGFKPTVWAGTIPYIEIKW